MDKTRLNSLIICFFFISLFATGVISDVVDIIRGTHELDIERFFLFRTLYLLLAVAFFGVSYIKKYSIINKAFSISILAIGMICVVCSAPGIINGTFVFAFGLILFVDAFDLWRNKTALGFIASLHIFLYIIFGKVHDCQGEKLFNTVFLDWLLISFLYSFYYKDKVKYFEKEVKDGEKKV
jgi:hypothetical protein